MDAAQEDRRRKLSQLDEIGPLYAGMYEVAVRLLDHCDQKWALVYVGHCGREILNRLPEIMIGKIESKHAQEDKAIKKLLDEWDGPRPWTELTDDDPELVQVHKGVMNAIGKYVDAREAGGLNDRQKSEVLAARGAFGVGQQDDLSIRGQEIHETRKWFMSFTHIDRLPERLPDEDVVRGHFAVFEEILDEYLNAFFRQRNAIADLLATANQRELGRTLGTGPEESNE